MCCCSSYYFFFLFVVVVVVVGVGVVVVAVCACCVYCLCCNWCYLRPTLDEIIAENGNEEEEDWAAGGAAHDEEEDADEDGEDGEEEAWDEDEVVEVVDDGEEQPPSPCSHTGARGYLEDEENEDGGGEDTEDMEEECDEADAVDAVVEVEDDEELQHVAGVQEVSKAAPARPPALSSSSSMAPAKKLPAARASFGSVVGVRQDLSVDEAAALVDAKATTTSVRQFLSQPSCAPLLKAGKMRSLSDPTDCGMVGALNDRCSEKEMQDRLVSRQLDIFEMAMGSSFVTPKINTALAVKKYQRSSADKMYLPEDIRSVEACAHSLFYLMTMTINSDNAPQKGLCELANDASYWQVYSFLRDRTRAVRVDLHVQQPWSTCTKAYILAHEISLRFEVLSMYLLTTTPEYLTKYDEKMAHKACSQIMEPLLNAYVQARVRASTDQPAFISPAEPAMRRYTILLLLVGGNENK
ncbi:unnamed protein product, partial [Polarella glacialis]